MKPNIDLYLEAIAQNASKIKEAIDKAQEERLPLDKMKNIFTQTLMSSIKISKEDSNDKVMNDLRLQLLLSSAEEGNIKATKVYDYLEKVFPQIKRNTIIDVIELNQTNQVIFKSFLDKIPSSDDDLATLMSKDDNLKKSFSVLISAIMAPKKTKQNKENTNSWTQTINQKEENKGLNK